MVETFLMKFENVEAGGRVFGKPYYNLRTPAGDNHYRNLDRFQHVDLIVPENRTKARGWLSVMLNYDSAPLIRVRAENLMVGAPRTSSLPGQLEKGNFISVILECDGVDGSEPYLVQIRLR